MMENVIFYYFPLVPIQQLFLASLSSNVTMKFEFRFSQLLVIFQAS